MIKLFFAIIFISPQVHATLTLLDKIAGVINDKVYTLSEVSRIQSTVEIRNNIAPFIYTQKKYSKLDILELTQNSFIVRDKLSELGFVISDDAVESRINETQKMRSITREDLIHFLTSNGITFNEYFELIREAIEFRVFQQRIISPLVTITDQELKNTYYKMNSKNKSLSFQYEVVDFILPKNKVLASDYKRLPGILDNYRKSGNIPQIYSDIETNNLGSVSDEDLPRELSTLLKVTDEKSFSKIYLKSSQIHIFYVVKKELAASKDYLQNKDAIYNKIFMERSQRVSQNWFSRESLNYYILKNI
jgi:peptidyl-prolyl cis-trans isomerase SurA